MSAPQPEPGVSAIVVAHDSGAHLEHCVEALASEGPPLLETIVVDNGSRDGAPQRVAAHDLASTRPALRLLELGANLGFGAANNRGAAVARGDVLLLLNADAWLAPGALPRLAAAFDADSRLGALSPQLRYPDDRWQFTWCPETGVWGEAVQMQRNRFEGRPWAHRALPRLLRALGDEGWLTAAALLVRRRAFEDVGGFDEEIFLYFEDVDLSRRLRDRGWRLRVDDGAVAFHVKGAGSPEGAAARELAYRRSQLRYYRRHRPAWELRFLERRLRRKAERLAEPLRSQLLAAIAESAP